MNICVLNLCILVMLVKGNCFVYVQFIIYNVDNCGVVKMCIICILMIKGVLYSDFFFFL